MKRKLLLTLLLLPLLCFAKHIDFMGLPLNMTIANFTAKAPTKGLTHDKFLSGFLDPGCRAFSGTFFGKNAQIFVYYNPKTKLVYRAKACVEFQSTEYAIEFLKSVSAGLESKYGEGFTNIGTQDDFPAFTYSIVDQTDSVTMDDDIYYPLIGIVDGYITEDDDSYSVHIDYIDSENSDKNDQNNINDL